MIEAVHVLVSGVVQGVGYRRFTEKCAQELGLGGWVRNLYDGRVELVAEGAPAVLDQLVERLRRGPRYAEVSELVRVRVEPSGADGFRVLRDAGEPAALDALTR